MIKKTSCNIHHQDMIKLIYIQNIYLNFYNHILIFLYLYNNILHILCIMYTHAIFWRKSCFLISPKDMPIDFRQRQRERNIDWLILICTQPWHVPWLGIEPMLNSNLTAYRIMRQPTEPHWPGRNVVFNGKAWHVLAPGMAWSWSCRDLHEAS